MNGALELELLRTNQKLHYKRLDERYITNLSTPPLPVFILAMRKLTPEQKVWVLNTHTFFVTLKSQGFLPPGKRLVRLVAQCLRIGSATVSRILLEERRRNAMPATPPSAEPLSTAPIAMETFGEIFMDIIRQRNLRRLPTTADHIRSETKKLKGLDVSTKLIRRTLKACGCSFIQGQSRDPRADAAENVNFRNAYLRLKVENYDGRFNPKGPEVYLDESYCNENHTNKKSWVLPDKVRYMRSGVGRRVCIVGAAIVWRQDRRIEAELLRDLTEFWASDAAPGDNDYHGNFTAPKFEKWFENLCITLLIRYGACRIHMDGASYHKRVLNPSPVTKWKKAEITKWLKDHNIPFPPNTHKKGLLEIARPHKPAPRYAAVEIAELFGHTVLYTPPYHPELQPIELVWGAVKNRIAQQPATSMADLLAKVGAELDKIDKRTWLGCYRKAQRVEKAYLDLIAAQQ